MSGAGNDWGKHRKIVPARINIRQVFHFFNNFYPLLSDAGGRYIKRNRPVSASKLFEYFYCYALDRVVLLVSGCRIRL